MLSREELKKLERKAKSLMLTKEIPQGKVEVVRSILSNSKLLEEERYRAIIELLKNCPDKPRSEPAPRKIDLSHSERRTRSVITTPYSPVSGITTGAENINSLYQLYKPSGLFRKRYLAASSNRLGFTLHKRLIPSQKFLKLFAEIKPYQEKISSRLSSIMEMIISDKDVDDPSVFNYLRIFHSWMMESPYSSLSLQKAKWCDPRVFENELKSWCIFFFSFRELDTSTKENIILSVETYLRTMPDLMKEQVLPFDNSSLREGKEKRNLEKEKIVYEYMMTLRSFLPSINPENGNISRVLQSQYSIQSIEELLVAIYGSLVFRRKVTTSDIIRFYSVKPPKISTSEWDYGKDALRQYGKDPESKKRRNIERLNETLSEYEFIYEMINLRFETIDFVRKAFDEQWKMINKRRQDGSDIYDKNFFLFLDECMTHFLSVYAIFINGEQIPMIDESGRTFSSSVFSKGYFESEFSTLFNLQSDILQYKTTNPNHIISHTEAKRIMMGQIPSMFEMESFIRQIGSAFYAIGRSLLKTIMLHNEWRTASNDLSPMLIRAPLEKLESVSQDVEIPVPVPFFDCRLGPDERYNAVQKMLVGRQIMSDSVKDGIIPSVSAYCLQFAHECFDRNILNDLEYRKDLIRKIEEAERS
ncbi:MAG TPA: hypothetical protein PKK43_02635 [Spirochaetota bacterium]|nr:hypothetical protein [Spirochaetota bacterium]